MSRIPRVLFVCLHGSAKSVIASEHLRRLAESRGIGLETASAGVEPDAEIPPRVAASLLAEGIDVRGHRPNAVSHEMFAGAQRVVSFGCDLTDMTPAGSAVTMWSDVPAVSDGYTAARDDILGRVRTMLDEIVLASAPAPAEP